ncbi:hypothetical protein [Serratia fonticola]|uniref:hypothetical protein n=1 Tax=Serratia fonticola TaxID=47917 RepID=UPI00093AF3C6|nr:hypothetical protein [Serratia fonticola]OKP27651.1 hypothetical protein BSQ40_14980 [Serratia fonticola]
MNKHRCSLCHKPLPIDHSQIKVGDKVTFSYQVTKMTQTKTSVKISERTGTVVSISSPRVEIIYRGSRQWLELTDVTPYDAPNALTVAFQGLCECNGDNHE